MKNKTFLFLVLVLTPLALGVGYWYSLSNRADKNTPVSAAAEKNSEPKTPQYPIEDGDKDAAPATATEKSGAEKPAVPAAVAFKAGEPLADRLERFFDPEKFHSLIVDKDLVHRFVVFIENISERRPSGTFALFTPLSDEFQITSADDDIIMNPKNYERYTPYIEFMNSFDAATLVRIYSHYYKEFQSSYNELGMGGYFNDRVVAATDVVLSTPDVPETAALKGVGPYRFANADFEAMPAAQKVLFRMGPENAKVLKEKIKDLRRLLTHGRR